MRVAGVLMQVPPQGLEERSVEVFGLGNQPPPGRQPEGLLGDDRVTGVKAVLRFGDFQQFALQPAQQTGAQFGRGDAYGLCQEIPPQPESKAVDCADESVATQEDLTVRPAPDAFQDAQDKMGEIGGPAAGGEESGEQLPVGLLAIEEVT